MASSGARLMILLLGTLALWALLALVATWAGLGGRFSLHPEDLGRVEDVPAVELAGATTQIPDMDRYAAISRRPLFSSDRLPFVGESTGDEETVAEEEVLMPLDATLTGVIMIGKDTAIALIKGNKSGESQSVKVGDSLQGDLSIYKLIELAPRKAVFDGPRGRSELELETFSGKGGTPVTPLRAAQTGGKPAAEAAPAGSEQQEPASEDNTPEAQAERIRRRIEERRRQMREEAERARSEQDR